MGHGIIPSSLLPPRLCPYADRRPVLAPSGPYYRGAVPIPEYGSQFLSFKTFVLYAPSFTLKAECISERGAAPLIKLPLQITKSKNT